MKLLFTMWWKVAGVLPLLWSICQAQQTPVNANSKRGLANPGTNHTDDLALFFSLNSSVRWYHNWSPNPSRVPSNDQHPLEFLPMVHGVDNLKNDLRAVQRLSTTNQNPSGRRKVLSFNEPDGSIESGGSNISPPDAAQAYLKYIVPLQQAPYNMLISHPSVTGTGAGIDWLRAFNTSCHQLRPGTGCPADFVAVHFYGDFGGLSSFLGQINGFYNADPSLPMNLPVYVTEFALYQSDAATAGAMLNQSLPFLDGLSYVAGYAWFGLFRTTEANSWTGPGNAMLDAGGGLTAIGSEYLGGPDRGFQIGARGSASMFNSGWQWGVGGSDGGFQGGGSSGGAGGGDGSSSIAVRSWCAFSKVWPATLFFTIVWTLVWNIFI